MPTVAQVMLLSCVLLSGCSAMQIKKRESVYHNVVPVRAEFKEGFDSSKILAEKFSVKLVPSYNLDEYIKAEDLRVAEITKRGFSKESVAVSKKYSDPRYIATRSVDTLKKRFKSVEVAQKINPPSGKEGVVQVIVDFYHDTDFMGQFFRCSCSMTFITEDGMSLSGIEGKASVNRGLNLGSEYSIVSADAKRIFQCYKESFDEMEKKLDVLFPAREG